MSRIKRRARHKAKSNVAKFVFEICLVEKIVQTREEREATLRTTEIVDITEIKRRVMRF